MCLSGVEEGLVHSFRHYRVVRPALVKQFFDLFIAFATIATNAKAFKQLAAGANTIVDSCCYLLVGDSLTNTYIHLIYLRGDFYK